MSAAVVTIARNTRGRDLIVGDVHGCFKKLRAQLTAINFDPDKGDRLFSVGDLVDRGPGSASVGEWLSQPWFHAIKGNHEDMLIGYHDGGLDSALYAMNGGAWAIGMTPEWRLPIVDAVRDLPFAIELDTCAGMVVLIHAEIRSDNWAKWREKLMAEDLNTQWVSTWSRGHLEADIIPPVHDIRALVAGHTPTMGLPVMRGNRFFIDTGAWHKGGEIDTPFCILDAHTLTNVAAPPGVMPQSDLRGFGG